VRNIAGEKMIQTDNQKLTNILLEKHGPLIGGKELACALGYPSLGAVREAKCRGRLPVKIFKIKNRRGHFALTTEIATWLTKLQSDAEEVSM
jgi:hypothetical protein